ncbi:M10 family metallopeptidase C-terminal domain-containing protein [Allosphingosinicella deserti]|uniref:Peptidase metallopeptidase domain-containing protein n=1 Tax=Allosphingosinicella deserti TaxID=2116704 RepID=A0A2P7QVT7_9SPHN|nr:M10 family metallopeptidase C-terminal domain-containing protein [Sphingomonas deserti]PSJ42063.1 hypothetical protein C7I55_07400 [Sphingomonas deserti]
MTRSKNVFSLSNLFNRFPNDRSGSPTPASEPTPYRLEDSTGIGTWAGKPIFNQEQVIAQIDGDARLQGRTITFGFLDALPTNQTGSVPGEYAGFSPLTEAQRTGTRDAMQLWDDLIAVRVVEQRGNGRGASPDILLANTITGPKAAWAYFPTDDGDQKTPQSSIWINPSPKVGNLSIGPGLFGSYTLIHEIGHSFGLSHPGDYDAGDDVPDDYESSAVYAQDSRQFTTMSYFPDRSTGGGDVWNSAIPTTLLPQTPLLHDILTIQEKYGADPTTRRGNTVYFADSNAGNPVYDLAENPFPFLCVYDAGGNDTFDFSTANMGVFLDLRAGSFSSASIGSLTLEEANALRAESDLAPWDAASYEGWLGFALSRNPGIVEADTGIAGITAPAVRNISIAYNTIIENAVGGNARDYLVGNDVANWLKGNGGDDVLNGLGGNDVLVGGKGADSFCFFDASGKDVILDFTSGTDKIDLTAIDANIFTEVDEAFAFIGSALFGGVAGELRSWASWGGHFLAGDTDGDKVADFTIDLGVATVVMADLFF